MYPSNMLRQLFFMSMTYVEEGENNDDEFVFKIVNLDNS